MPAPPGMGGMPPPPGMGGMPTPPPPMGAAIMAPINQNPVASPPPIMVQAAPREDNLSDDEKDDLLGELGA